MVKANSEVIAKLFDGFRRTWYRHPVMILTAVWPRLTSNANLMVSELLLSGNYSPECELVDGHHLCPAYLLVFITGSYFLAPFSYRFIIIVATVADPFVLINIFRNWLRCFDFRDE